MVVRWGILGTGGVADSMAKILMLTPGAAIVGVASQTQGRASWFADQHGIPAWYQSADAMAAADVDVIYVASTNDRHPADTIACLERGRAVLCEKPFAVDAGEAARMVDAAVRHGAFLMEAMWMPFLPFWAKVVGLVSEGAIGRIQTIQADFGFPADPDPVRRFFDPERGGGALLDVGIYPLTLACLLAGEPVGVAAVGVKALSGVDAQVGMTLEHPGGVVSVLSASYVAETPTTAVISGTRGRILLESPFYRTGRIRLEKPGSPSETFDVGPQGSVHRYEVDEVHRCLRDGRLESEIHPLDRTLMVMRVVDAVRAAAFGR